MSDAPISVYIDNNVWDFLFAREIDLATELPRDEFVVCITREAEFEIPPIPDAKADLKAFIDLTIQTCAVKTDILFGFYDTSLSAEEQRFGGFDVGRWAHPDEIAALQRLQRQQKTPLRLNAKTKLYQDEADLSLAIRSFTGVVLSLDAKAGPINTAYRQGGKVVFLTDFDRSGMTLKDFIKSTI